MPPEHRIERLANRIAERIEQKSDMLARGLKGDTDRPPFTVRLTKEEQLEQWFGMDETKWLKVIEERGLDEATKYSLAMQKLHAEVFGPAEQTTVMLAPQQYAALGEGIGNGMGPPTQEPPIDIAAITQGMQPQPQNVQAILGQTLASVGLDPSQVGG
jgi:hypothetical protein